MSGVRRKRFEIFVVGDVVGMRSVEEVVIVGVVDEVMDEVRRGERDVRGGEEVEGGVREVVGGVGGIEGDEEGRDVDGVMVGMGRENSVWVRGDVKGVGW